jgi:hypothetical protein
MKNFKKINDLEICNLKDELTRLLSNNIIEFSKSNQISITTTKDHPDDFNLGVGHLLYDWSKLVEVKNADGTTKRVPSEREFPLKEEDFSIVCSQFKDTLFEEMYDTISKKYRLGRVRIMKMAPRYTMSWHHDLNPRLHLPIKTQPGCFMVIEDEVMHIPQSTWYLTNTELFHTAVNSSDEERIHVVATILDSWKSVC